MEYSSKIKKKTYRSDVHVWLELNHRPVGHDKQCSLVWSCVEEIERSSKRHGFES